MTQNTVFVIGAGASKEAGLPTGYELKSKISKLLDIRFDQFGSKQKSGDYQIMAALRLYLDQLYSQEKHISELSHKGEMLNSYLFKASNYSGHLTLF